jgi:hypothetical protein
MRIIVGREGLDLPTASSSEMGRFETEELPTEAKPCRTRRSVWTWIDRVHRRRPPDGIILGMDSSESPTFGQQQGQMLEESAEGTREDASGGLPSFARTLLRLRGAFRLTNIPSKSTVEPGDGRCPGNLG